MSRNKKILLGWLSCFPLLWAWGGGFYTLFLISGNNDSFPGTSFGLLFLGQMIAVGLAFGLVIYYSMLIDRNKNMDKSTAIKWIISLVLLHIMAIPAYWYLYIWQEHTENLQNNDYVIKP